MALFYDAWNAIVDSDVIQAVEIEWLMLLTPDFGKVCFLGTRPIGETWKFGKGGSKNGPATRPRDISLLKLAVTISDWARPLANF